MPLENIRHWSDLIVQLSIERAPAPGGRALQFREAGIGCSTIITTLWFQSMLPDDTVNCLGLNENYSLIEMLNLNRN